MYGDSSWMYLRTVAQAGVLSKLDAVDVHLYTGAEPESQIVSLLRLRRLIDQYSPERKIPITVSEWGYTWGSNPAEQFYRRRSSPQEQARFLARSQLINRAHEVNLSVWYDWKDDPWDPTSDWAHHFGVITDSGEPKPAYHALQTLTQTLDGCTFVRRIGIGSNRDFLLLFKKGPSAILAAWTTSDFHSVTFPGTTTGVQSVDLFGEKELLTPNAQGLSVPLTDSPRYVFLPEGSVGNETATWSPDGTFFRLDPQGRGKVPIILQNSSGQQETFDLQASLNGNAIGSVSADLAPNETRSVDLPVEIQSTTGQSDYFVQVVVTSHANQQADNIFHSAPQGGANCSRATCSLPSDCIRIR
jgi:hypothetical protein